VEAVSDFERCGNPMTKVGKYIVPFDESNKVYEIKDILTQYFTDTTWYKCDNRDFNTAKEMETYAIFDTSQEANKVANMTFGQHVVNYIQSNRAIERLCREKVKLKYQSQNEEVTP
jgi:hypothetical protein